MLIGDGLVGTPSVSFESDTDTGIYRPSDNQVGVSVGGVLRLLVGVSQTSISFDNAYVRMTSDTSRFYYQVGTSSTSLSGSVLSFGKIGTTAYSMRVDTVNDRVQFPDGSIATPSITFGSDLATGVYKAGTNIIGFTNNGTAKFIIAPTYTRSVSPVWLPDGTAALPAMTFNSDTDTGIYRVGTNQIGISRPSSGARTKQLNLNGPVYPIEGAKTTSFTDILTQPIQKRRNNSINPH